MLPGLMKRAAWLLFLPLFLALLGCGHPASVQECEAIVERITQLELGKHAPGSADRKLVEQEIADAKKSLHDQTMKDCVGRRITNRALTCVREAQSSQKIIDDCFN
jgi:hypothetical protein